jgi:hypothetical protein
MLVDCSISAVQSPQKLLHEIVTFKYKIVEMRDGTAKAPNIKIDGGGDGRIN